MHMQERRELTEPFVVCYTAIMQWLSTLKRLYTTEIYTAIVQWLFSSCGNWISRLHYRDLYGINAVAVLSLYTEVWRLAITLKRLH